ncbi:MAG: polyphosphate polymerase domain-containing protein [Myxococcota bacterium]|nr:polyphosphate polymerase domain-containing protein [Myxococcota bacterium]
MNENSANRIQRFELKYLIDRESVGLLRSEIAPYCRADAHNPAPNTGYAIHSIYADTPDWFLFHASRRNDFERIKLRLRSYQSGPAFLEVKRKVGEVIEKTRARVHREDVEEAVTGFLCPQQPEQQRGLSRFAYFAARLGASPRILVSYLREAYVSEVDGYARVTFDHSITAREWESWSLNCEQPEPIPLTLDDAWQYDGLRSPTVLELKCESRVPYWLLDLIRRHRLQRSGFSKYCYGALAVTRRLSGLDHAFLESKVYV